MVSSTTSAADKPTSAFKRLKSRLVKLKEDTRRITSYKDASSKSTTEPVKAPESNPESVTVAPAVSLESACTVVLECTSPEGHIISPAAEEEEDTTLSRPTAVTSESADESKNNSQEAAAAETLAHRIQALLSVAVPQGCTPSTLFSFESKNNPTTLNHPLESSGSAETTTLLSLLSSAFTMNVSLLKSLNINHILERRPNPNPKAQSTPDLTMSCDDTVQSQTTSNSVVISCPLEPSEDTEVEIARSEIHQDLEEVAADQRSRESFLVAWLLRKDKGKGKAISTDPSPPMAKEEVRIWYPSRTKVSLEVTWWGYRIYLPPPAMRVLSDKSLEAAKRAALITTALSWLVKRIPMATLPPQLKSAVLVVRKLVPLLGYIGGFIAWSWTAVQSFDKGNGVILSATWLLPIALVPGTWFYTDDDSAG